MAINTVSISGNLTRDAELRTTKGGAPITRFTVAVNMSRKGANGEWEEYVNFIDCTMFGTRAEKLTPYLTKGAKVAVEGALSQFSYEKDGAKRSKVEVNCKQIEFLSARKEQQTQEDTYLDDQYWG